MIHRLFSGRLRESWVHCGILTLFLAVVILVVHLVYPDSVYGSQTDWSNQHFAIPEYFRTRFYATGELFPNFALHLGGGQNIYNFAYYGLYNPIQLLSYCFPHVTMAVYLQVVSILNTWLSTMLCYVWMRKWHPAKMSFFLTFLFLTAAPVIFHGHHHVMFVNYFPFLFWGLLAIHRALFKGRSLSLILAAACILLSSFFFSVGAFLVLFCYGIVLALHWHHLHVRQQVFRACSIVALHLMLAAMLVMFFLMPVVFTLLSGRDISSESISLWKLFFPAVHLRYLTYSPFSIGTTAIGIFATVAMLRTERRPYRALAFLFVLLLFLPLSLYLMNGTMYLDPKAYIPFLPLLLLLCGGFLESLFARQIPLRSAMLLYAAVVALGLLFYDGTGIEQIAAVIDAPLLLIAVAVFYRWNKRWAVWGQVAAFSMLICFSVNLGDGYMKKSSLEVMYSPEIQEIVDLVSEKDSSFYRISEEYHAGDTVNCVWGPNCYRSSVYSSVHNAALSDFYFKTAYNENSIRNKTMMVQPKNPIFGVLMGEKYLITKKPISRYGYQLIEKRGDYLCYQNMLSFPIGFATSHVMTEEQMRSMGYPMQLEGLLENAVVSESDLPEGVESQIQIPESTREITPAYHVSAYDSSRITDVGEGYYVHSDKDFVVTVTLDEPIDAMLLLQMHADNGFGKKENTGDISITVNGVRNKLTDPKWKYQNDNNFFQYTLSADEPIQTLTIRFSAGNYVISDCKMYTLSYSVLEKAGKSVDAWQLDHNQMGGDSMSGDISVQQDGWFVLSLPYDNGFHILVDGKQTEYFRTDSDFIGFPIAGGTHQISVSYRAPGLSEGILCSKIGIGCVVCYFISAYFVEKRKKTMRNAKSHAK